MYTIMSLTTQWDKRDLFLAQYILSPKVMWIIQGKGMLLIWKHSCTYLLALSAPPTQKHVSEENMKKNRLNFNFVPVIASETAQWNVHFFTDKI